MKLILIIGLLFLSYKSFSQKNYKITEAHYSYSFASSDKNISEMFLTGLTYILSTNGIYSVLKGEEIGDLTDHIHTNKQGPSFAQFNILKNLVYYQDIDTLYNFHDEHFLPTSKKHLINDYKCYSIVNKRGDTLYLSKDLPFYINPFFLNLKSIKYGVVKAILANRGTYLLTDLKKLTKSDSLNFKTEIKTIINSDNYYFKD